jgi:tetratricopeptide (TPR) repeat protein
MTKHYDTLSSLLISKTNFFVLSVAVLITPLLVCLFLYFLVYIPWSIEHGHNWKGASNKWRIAMESGDGENAIYWAKRAQVYGVEKFRDEVYHQLALAYELNGQYDIALCYYKLAYYEYGEFARWRFSPFPRIFYAQGKRQEAFEAYCEMMSWRDLTGRHQRRLFYESVSGTLYFSGHPFKDYREFLAFMEEEYEKLGHPEEYREMMVLFQTIGTDINDEHL